MIFAFKNKRDWPSSNIPNVNNLDLLRFCFASMVFLVHAYHLSNAKSLKMFEQIISSKLAVECFFVVSGFLIFMSYENSTCLRAYFEKRIRRIYPAYVVVIIGFSLAGALITIYSLSDYFSSPQLYKYLLTNMVFLNFLQQDLPGVFVNIPFNAVNGALWTLKIEVMFYLTVPMLAFLFHKVGLWQGLLMSYLLSMAYRYGMAELIHRHGGIYVELQRQLPGQLAFFVAGGALFYYFDWVKLYRKAILIIAFILLIAHYGLDFNLGYPIGLAIIIIYLGFFIRYFGRFGKYGDFSYGLYILHFPILQIFIAKGYFANQPWLGLILSIISVLYVAFLLWHFVEKPSLKKTSHYIQETTVISKSKKSI